MTTNDRVCPRCGTPTAESVFCASCGVNLRQQGELPSAEAFAAKQREEAWLAKEEARRIEEEEGAKLRARDDKVAEARSPHKDVRAASDEVEQRQQGAPAAASPERDDAESAARPGKGRGTRAMVMVGLLLLAGGVAVAGYAIGRGTGGDLEAARETGAQAGEEEGAKRGGELGYEAGFEEGRREAYESEVESGSESAEESSSDEPGEAGAGDPSTGTPAPASEQELDCGTVTVDGQEVGYTALGYYGASQDQCGDADEHVTALGEGSGPANYECSSTSLFGAECSIGDGGFRTYRP
jgi:uncharacterized Zn finger protein (UPF0148 family)